MPIARLIARALAALLPRPATPGATLRGPRWLLWPRLLRAQMEAAHSFREAMLSSQLRIARDQIAAPPAPASAVPAVPAMPAVPAVPAVSSLTAHARVARAVATSRAMVQAANALGACGDDVPQSLQVHCSYPDGMVVLMSLGMIEPSDDADEVPDDDR